MRQRGDPGSLREKSAWGAGEEARGRQRKRPAPRTMEPPWRPLRGQCGPPGPAVGCPRAAGPRSSCLFRTRPCKCGHLILNPLRRYPCERGKGWPYNPLQSEAWEPRCSAKCLHHACKWSRSLGEIGRKSLCPVVGEQNQPPAVNPRTSAPSMPRRVLKICQGVSPRRDLNVQKSQLSCAKSLVTQVFTLFFLFPFSLGLCGQ